MNGNYQGACLFAGALENLVSSPLNLGPSVYPMPMMFASRFCLHARAMCPRSHSLPKELKHLSTRRKRNQARFRE